MSDGREALGGTDRWLIDAPHALDGQVVAGDLGVDPETGLDHDEVDRRRREVGPNRLGREETTPWWRLLWNQLASAVVVLLAAAGLVGLLVGEVIEAVAIAVVLVANTIIGFATEYQAVRSMAALRDMVSTVAEVERDDRRDEIDAGELVPGDVVTVEGGERVPADVRLLEAEALEVEESALTGESEPVTKGTDPVDAEAPVGDRIGMLFMGTTARSGRGRGVVVATGRSTEMGRVAQLAGQADETRAPLQEGLARLSRTLAVVVVVGAAVLVALGLLRGRQLDEVVEVAIALAIAVVPEGLPAVATLTLAVGMRRMARRNALVRNLPAVETLGSTTVVCSDKTGTLTTNRMAVVEVELSDGVDERDLWVTAVLCNDADIDPDGDPVGDPTEVALIDTAEERGVDWRQLREEQRREREVPFDPEAKRMATVYDGTVHVKGAPEVLLDPHRDRRLAEATEAMVTDALRTLAIARRDAPPTDADDAALFDHLVVLGVTGMHDPPRESAIRAVELLREAGIRTVMITGDQPETALGVARQLGLSTSGAAGGAVTGRDLADADDRTLIDLAGGVDVFARVDPAHKLRVIRALQERGEVVAVTGDGVNDAPALSQAAVGVAMGSGTDVAHDAADIILTDDDFSTIEAAVEEGRRIFANIRRFAQFLFSWHVAEVAVVAAGLVLGIDPPLAGLMILWNNLIIDVVPSFALALEPSRADVMRQPPRPPDEAVIHAPIVRRILLHGALVAATGLAAYGLGLEVLRLEVPAAQTMTFLTLTAAQVLAVFNARTDRGSGFRGASRNPWLLGAIALTALLEAVALALPPLRGTLGLEVPPAAGWVAIAVLAPLPLLLVQGWRIGRAR